MKFLHVAVGGVAQWLNRCDDVCQTLSVSRMIRGDVVVEPPSGWSL
jgi:hypothetical protein